MACTRDVAAHKVRRILLSLKSPRQISANEQACALPLDPTPPHNCTRTPGIPRRKAVAERTVQNSAMPEGFGAAAAGVSRARGCTLAAILVLAVALVMLQGARAQVCGCASMEAQPTAVPHCQARVAPLSARHAQSHGVT